jgi:precorrin-8X/cobalt-precorrin-8 methylmutase
MIMENLSPREIEVESMRIIEREAGAHSFTPAEWTVVKRIIHATADFEVMKNIRFQPQALMAGIEAIKQGRSIYADTEMLAAAIAKRASQKFGCRVICLVGDEEVKNRSAETGMTRSAVAMRMAAPALKGGIIAIGNAPTALQEVIRLHTENVLAVDLVLGMPIGFVGAAESKQELVNSSLRYIAMLGRKGGTPAAAAALNALMQLAGGL